MGPEILGRYLDTEAILFKSISPGRPWEVTRQVQEDSDPTGTALPEPEPAIGDDDQSARQVSLEDSQQVTPDEGPRHAAPHAARPE